MREGVRVAKEVGGSGVESCRGLAEVLGGILARPLSSIPLAAGTSVPVL